MLKAVVMVVTFAVAMVAAWVVRHLCVEGRGVLRAEGARELSSDGGRASRIGPGRGRGRGGTHATKGTREGTRAPRGGGGRGIVSGRGCGAAEAEEGGGERAFAEPEHDDVSRIMGRAMGRMG